MTLEVEPERDAVGASEPGTKDNGTPYSVATGEGGRAACGRANRLVEKRCTEKEGSGEGTQLLRRYRSLIVVAFTSSA
jgi:hypothetical protein